jgi:N-acetylmuramoyl-L-alanine amidase
MNPLGNILKQRKTLVFLTIMVISLVVIVLVTYFLLLPKTARVAPKVPNKVFTVIIDAGHGGRDEGTKYKGVKEKDITLAIAKQVAAMAPLYNLKVVLTRDSDTFLNPVARVAFASQQNADAYLAIHVNELRGYSYISGMQVYVSNKNPDFEQSRLLGSAVAQDLGADFKVSPRLQQRATNIFVLADNSMPSILVECGFITNPSDLKLLTDTTQTLQIAKQMLAGIAAYAKHDAINLYAVQIASPSNSSHHKVSKGIIAANHITNRKGHKKSLKTA